MQLKITGASGASMTIRDSFDLRPGATARYTLLAGASGLSGPPPRDVFTSDGAGPGTTYLGRRYQARPLSLPIRVDGSPTSSTADLVEFLTALFDDAATLAVTLDDGTVWKIGVVLQTITPPVWGVDTDRSKRAKFTLNMLAPDPFWKAATVTTTPLTNGSPVSLSPGVETPATVTFTGAASAITVTGPRGEVVTYGPSATNLALALTTGKLTNGTYGGIGTGPTWFRLPATGYLTVAWTGSATAAVSYTQQKGSIL